MPGSQVSRYSRLPWPRATAQRARVRHTAGMAYDEGVAQRLRSLVRGRAGVVERAMFGGLAFLVDGHMAVSASSKGGLLLRVDPRQTDELLAVQGVSQFAMGERQLNGWLHVAADVVADDADLARWVERGLSYARSLPPK